MTELNNISKIDFGNNVVLTQNNITKNNYSIEYLMNKVNNKLISELFNFKIK